MPVSIETRKQMINSRLINLLRGVAIVLVLLGHSLQYGSGKDFLQGGFYWENLLMKFIYSFHMPLFMCISGYLMFYSVENHGVYKSTLSRIKRFIPVLMTWSCILNIWDWLFRGKSFLFKRFVYYVITDFWFLWAVIVCAIGLLIVEWIYERLKLPEKFGYYLIVLLIAIVLFFITPDYYVIASYKYMFPYYLAGYLYAKYHCQFLGRSIFGSAMIIIWAILLTRYNYESYIYTTGITIIQNDNTLHQIGINIFRYAIGLFGSCGCIWIIKVIDSRLQLFSEINTVKIGSPKNVGVEIVES